MWSIYLPKPLKRTMEFHMNFDGYKCQFYEDFGGGDYMTRWSGGSSDGCVVLADTRTNELMVRKEGLIYLGTVYPEEIQDYPAGSYTSIQQLMYNFELTRNC
ncbi:hypothetical protein BG015_002125 [Linnemannia schmuckeri]|uniref:Uncharacterized protein n=1 Tax=Linnemannia schmuckeri TaxID=64567 RepID=A0A9P5RQT8_9FUNG|nr:hypothetical protein BG015_002125 [Linnemannia schmuckeri]